MNDRALRAITLGQGGRANGYPRESGFDITAASEVMAILAVSRDLHDLRKRLGAITVAQSYDGGKPVTAEDLGAAGAMTVLLKEALKPNLIQTLEGQPCLMHAGPFANIAHGNSSLVADLIGLKLGDYVITESGFGSDMGMEKFFDIVCRGGGLRPNAVVLVATVRALKHHGGIEDDPRVEHVRGLAAIATGAANLHRHLGIVRSFGLPCVVAVNRRPGDTDEEVELVRSLALEGGALAAEVNDAFARGGEGAAELAQAVADACEEPSEFKLAYEDDDPIQVKIEKVAKQVYGASDVVFYLDAERKIRQYTDDGLDKLPICMAKTHLSLSADPALRNAPEDFTLPVRDMRAYTGAGWLVPLCGDIQQMPGLGKAPAALNVDIDARGEDRRAASDVAQPHRHPARARARGAPDRADRAQGGDGRARARSPTTTAAGPPPCRGCRRRPSTASPRFYDDLVQPRGQRHVSVCTGTACWASDFGDARGGGRARGSAWGWASARRTARCRSARRSASASATRRAPCARATSWTPARTWSTACSRAPCARPSEPESAERARRAGAARARDVRGAAPRARLADARRSCSREVKEANVRGRGGAGFPAGHEVGVRRARGRSGPGDRRQRRRGRPGLLHRQAADGAQPGAAARGHGARRLRRRRAPRLRAGALRVPALDADPARGGRALARRRSATSTVEIVEGAGSYVVGEETALLASLQGFRGTVSARPPFPAERGFHGKPTVVHNVETLCNIPFIALHGAEAYKALSPGATPGTKLVCLNDRFVRPGMYEVRFGTPVSEICEELGGGLRRRPLDQGGADRRAAGRHPAGLEARHAVRLRRAGRRGLHGRPRRHPGLRRAHRRARAGAPPARVRRARELRQVLPVPDRAAAGVRDGRPARRPRPRAARGAAGDARAGLAVRARRRHAGADPQPDRALRRGAGRGRRRRRAGRRSVHAPAGGAPRGRPGEGRRAHEGRDRRPGGGGGARHDRSSRPPRRPAATSRRSASTTAWRRSAPAASAWSRAEGAGGAAGGLHHALPRRHDAWTPSDDDLAADRRRHRRAGAVRAARAARRAHRAGRGGALLRASASRAGRASAAAPPTTAAIPTWRCSTSCASRAGAACAPATRSRARSR